MINWSGVLLKIHYIELTFRVELLISLSAASLQLVLQSFLMGVALKSLDHQGVLGKETLSLLTFSSFA